MNIDRKPRVVIYGAGQFGQYIARFAVRNGWTIVAAVNRAGAKVGQDIGRLAGLDRDLGVVVQDADKADFAKLDADIAVVTSGNNFLSYNIPIYRCLLGAGLNVICHSIEAYYPQGNDKVIAAEIDALAKQHGVTFSGGGIWDATRVWPGIIVTGMSTEFTTLLHKSISDCTRAGKAAMLETGLGMSIDEFMEKRGGPRAGGPAVYKTVPEMVLWAIGYTIKETRTRVEPIVFDKPIACPLLEREIPAGGCVGARAIAEIETEEGVSARTEIEARLFWPGEVEYMYWSIDGRPVTNISMGREDNAHATAACLFNRIPDVIAAPPGIVPCAQLGPMKHSAPRRNAMVI